MCRVAGITAILARKRKPRQCCCNGVIQVASQTSLLSSPTRYARHVTCRALPISYQSSSCSWRHLCQDFTSNKSPEQWRRGMSTIDHHRLPLLCSQPGCPSPCPRCWPQRARPGSPLRTLPVASHSHSNAEQSCPYISLLGCVCTISRSCCCSPGACRSVRESNGEQLACQSSLQATVVQFRYL